MTLPSCGSVDSVALVRSLYYVCMTDHISVFVWMVSGYWDAEKKFVTSHSCLVKRKGFETLKWSDLFVILHPVLLQL